MIYWNRVFFKYVNVLCCERLHSYNVINYVFVLYPIYLYTWMESEVFVNWKSISLTDKYFVSNFINRPTVSGVNDPCLLTIHTNLTENLFKALWRENLSCLDVKSPLWPIITISDSWALSRGWTYCWAISVT